jgi:hypothetical protein
MWEFRRKRRFWTIFEERGAEIGMVDRSKGPLHDYSLVLSKLSSARR